MERAAKKRCVGKAFCGTRAIIGRSSFNAIGWYSRAPVVTFARLSPCVYPSVVNPSPIQKSVILPDHHGATALPTITRRCSPGALRIRCTAVALLLFAFFCFYIAAQVTPSPSGYGTHRQLGYPACLMPILTGHPCPTCGMTTAFSYTIRGQLLDAFHAQPAGLALALGLFGASLCCVRVFVTGNYDFVRLQAQPGRIALLVVAIVLFGWIYKLITFSP